jgi:anti-anti-sigma regulatory factor
VLVLEGRLAGVWVQVLEDSWREVANNDRAVTVMVSAVTFVDEKGKALLADMHQHGCELVAEGCMNTAIVEDIKQGGRQ